VESGGGRRIARFRRFPNTPQTWCAAPVSRGGAADPTHALTPDEYNAVRESQLCRVRFEDLVVFEDSAFIVINKPFDLRIDAGRDAACVWSTLADALRVFRDSADVPVPPKFCHQFDYSTSGIIVIAKTRAAAGSAAARVCRADARSSDTRPLCLAA
jgi:23S rRNA-/tRNA-specific pseudouridylate synthase